MTVAVGHVGPRSPESIGISCSGDRTSGVTVPPCPVQPVQRENKGLASEGRRWTYFRVESLWKSQGVLVRGGLGVGGGTRGRGGE